MQRSKQAQQSIFSYKIFYSVTLMSIIFYHAIPLIIQWDPLFIVPLESIPAVPDLLLGSSKRKVHVCGGE